ncbi:hypothetical protein DAETH_01080 [Deinococcus aetherius]|uniref:Uncharacterized protein n=1 Tax=Deinococcus aetherius TaxID=200252 RepID=A0ABN6RE19_9DEIO|nr:hypothetical protein [Deinococcus aetherius]BDP40139.1 hypothetical protein DAETH_01080 [Deinococcus aetherius]
MLLKGQTWSHDEVDERWQVAAFKVAEHRLELGRVNPTLETDHPRLRERQEEWIQLMFAAPPLSEAKLLNDLRTAHLEKEWGLFGRFGLGGQLSFGSGVFATGPRSLMAVYRRILEAQEMRPSELWSSPHPEHYYSSPPVLCLHLNGTAWVDDTYVLAQSFHATQLP